MAVQMVGIADSIPCAYCATEIVVVEQIEDGTRVRYAANGTLTDYYSPSEYKRAECWTCSPEQKPGEIAAGPSPA